MGAMGEMGRGRARGLPARFPQEHKERFRRKVMGWMGEMGVMGEKIKNQKPKTKNQK